MSIAYYYICKTLWGHSNSIVSGNQDIQTAASATNAGVQMASLTTHEVVEAKQQSTALNVVNPV